MAFDKLFQGKSWPEANERIGVMSVDSLNRQWDLVLEERGYLIARLTDGNAVLLGRMCIRDDGKFCIEIVVRATIENNPLRDYEFWHVDLADKLRHLQWLQDVIRDHLRQV